MNLLRVLSRRRSAREAVEREAAQLTMFLGDMAYDEARSRARACRNAGDHSGAWLWSQVAVTIAKRSGYEIGVKAADRYERDRGLEGKALARPMPDIAASTRPVLSTLAEIAGAGMSRRGCTMSAPTSAMQSVWQSKILPFRQRLRRSAGRRARLAAGQMRQQITSRAVRATQPS